MRKSAGCCGRNVKTKAARRSNKYRLPIREEVKVRCDDWEEFRVEHAENISEGGIFLKTENLLPPGTTFRLILRVRGEEISAVAQVIWTKEFSREGRRICGMGARFLEMSENDRTKIRQLISKALDDVRES